MATTKLWTIEDVARLPDDEFRYALIRGELFRALPWRARDGRIVAATGARLYNHIVNHRLGFACSGSGFILERNPDTLLCPALSCIRSGRVPADMNGYPELAPDLVVEVATLAQPIPSAMEESGIYLAAGVRLVWIIDPDRRTVRVHRSDGSDSLLSDQDQIDGEDVLPGFRLPVAQFFD